jgi:hypothetical protein
MPNSSKSKDECSICQEYMNKDITKLKCGHEFHTKCIDKWFRVETTCPLCRKVAPLLPIMNRQQIEAAELAAGNRVPFLGVVVCYKNNIIGRHLNTEFNLTTTSTLEHLKNALIERYREWANSGICQRVAGGITNALYGTGENRFSCVPFIKSIYEGIPTSCSVTSWGNIYENPAIEDGMPLSVMYELYQFSASEAAYNENNDISVLERTQIHDVIMPAELAYPLSWIVIELGYRNKNRGGKRRTQKIKSKYIMETKKRKWSMKYKKSINCKSPKGFSQKQYCKYGRTHKKRSNKMKGGVGGTATRIFGTVLNSAKSGAKTLSEEIAKDIAKQEIFKNTYSNKIGKNENENVNPNMIIRDKKKEEFMNKKIEVAKKGFDTKSSPFDL